MASPGMSQDPYGAGPSPGPFGAAQGGMRAEPIAVTYECGDCGALCQIRAGDIIQCRECGYRILYKTRTAQVVQFDAR